MKAFFTSIAAAVAVGGVASVLLAMGTNTTQAEQPVLKLDMTGIAYTADEIGNSISAIDLVSGKVKIVTVPISPHNVQITADGAQLLAVGEPAMDGHGGQAGAGHGAKEAKGRLLVFDAGKLLSGPIASIQVGSHPAHVVVDVAGRRAFVTNSGDNAVAVVDLSRKMVVRTVPAGRSPHGLRISPDGRELYASPKPRT